MSRIIPVDFRGDQLFGFETDGGVFVALKPMVEAMGMDWSGQFRRVQRDPILSEGIAMMATPFGRGGDQEALCLRLDLVNGWLFTIDTNRIRDEAVKARVLTYQRECYRVLAEHFAGVSAQAAPELAGDPNEAEGTRLRMVTEARQTFGAKAAGQLWFRLGLPIVPAMTDGTRQLDMLDYSRIVTTATGGRAA